MPFGACTGKAVEFPLALEVRPEAELVSGRKWYTHYVFVPSKPWGLRLAPKMAPKQARGFKRPPKAPQDAPPKVASC